MGIGGLLKELDKCITDFNSAKNKCLVQKRAGIDISCWLNNAIQTYNEDDSFITAKETDRYLSYILRHLIPLYKNGIIPYCVFDGNKLPAKSITHIKRHALRDDNMKKANEQQDIRKITRLAKVSYRSQSNLARIFDVIGVDYIFAPYEADAQLAWLFYNNKIDFVITEDSDITIYNCDIILYKYHRLTDYKSDFENVASDFYGDLYSSDCIVNTFTEQVLIAKVKKGKKRSLNEPETLFNDDIGVDIVDDCHDLYNYLCDSNISLHEKKSLLKKIMRFACAMAGCDYYEGLPSVGLKTALLMLSSQFNTEKISQINSLSPTSNNCDFWCAIITQSIAQYFDADGVRKRSDGTARKNAVKKSNNDAAIVVEKKTPTIPSLPMFYQKSLSQNSDTEIYNTDARLKMMAGVMLAESVYDNQVVWDTNKAKLVYLRCGSDNIDLFESFPWETIDIKKDRIAYYGEISDYLNVMAELYMRGRLHTSHLLFPTQACFDECANDLTKKYYMERNGDAVSLCDKENCHQYLVDQHMAISSPSEWFADFDLFFENHGGVDNFLTMFGRIKMTSFVNNNKSYVHDISDDSILDNINEIDEMTFSHLKKRKHVEEIIQ